jgi:hypothetical protein
MIESFVTLQFLHVEDSDHHSKFRSFSGYVLSLSRIESTFFQRLDKKNLNSRIQPLFGSGDSGNEHY